MKTIFALATGPGRAGIAVFRLSGAVAGDVLQKMRGGPLPAARIATSVIFRDPISHDVIDHGLCLWFPGPQSYTGEDVAEFHVHGGRSVCQAITNAVLAVPGVRLAEPGEFTRRAFEFGKMDLTEAEAVADLVDAETDAQRRQALRQMEGALGALYEDWRGRLVRSAAFLEAWIDFPDEDLPDDVIGGVLSEIAELDLEIGEHLADGGRGERLREGIHIAIIGDPNVGKSTLLNLLGGRNAAIVSPHAGTTRDVIELAMDIGGYPVIMADTAGIRDGIGEIEQEGVRRAVHLATTSDLKIVMFDGQSDPTKNQRVSSFVDENSLVVFNKNDLDGFKAVKFSHSFACLSVSLKTGKDVPDVFRAVEKMVEERFNIGANPTLTQARHRAALVDCRSALERAGNGVSLEFQAEDLRLAVRGLGRITGRVDVDDLLDVIFGEFCIGK